MILFFNRRELRYSVWEANFSLFYVCSVIWNDRGLLWFSHYSEFKILIPNVQLSKAFAPCALWRNKRQNFLASEQQFISSVQSWKLVLKHELNVWKEERQKERKNTDSSVQDRHSCLVSDSLGPGTSFCWGFYNSWRQQLFYSSSAKFSGSRRDSRIKT